MAADIFEVPATSDRDYQDAERTARMQNVPRNRLNTWPRVFAAMPFGKKKAISSPVYKELSGLKPVDWGEIQSAKARYFGSQLQEWNARVRKAKRQRYVGDILTLSRDAPNRFVEWRLRLDAVRALSDLGRFERARELLRAMVTENPTCPETRYALAKTLDRLAGLAAPPELGREFHGRAELEIQEALSHGGGACALFRKKPLLVTPEQTIKLVDGTQITFEALNRPV